MYLQVWDVSIGVQSFNLMHPYIGYIPLPVTVDDGWLQAFLKNSDHLLLTVTGNGLHPIHICIHVHLDPHDPVSQRIRAPRSHPGTGPSPGRCLGHHRDGVSKGFHETGCRSGPGNGKENTHGTLGLMGQHGW